MCIRHKDVFTVCCHVRLGEKQACKVAEGIRAARRWTWCLFQWSMCICLTTTKEHLVFSFCPKCAKHFSSGGGNPHSDSAILNYWAYKNRQGFRGPMEPSLFPMDKIFHSVASDYTDAYLLHRLELVALSDALREETVREWFEREINKDGVVVEPWNLISGLGHIRQETLAQAFARKYARPEILPAESEEERRSYEESESKRIHAHPLKSNPSHVVARMEIRGQVDGDGQVFRVNPDAYQRGLSDMAVKGGAGQDPGNKGKFIPKTANEAERQQRDPSPPRIARRLSTLFVVEDDSDEDANPQFVVGSDSDDDSIPDEVEMAQLHATLDGVENDITNATDQTTVGPVQIVTRHKAILCNKVYVPSLRGSIRQQPQQAMAGDNPIPARVSSLQQFATIHRGPSIRSVHGEVGTIPDISLQEELAEADFDSVASSPINLSPRSSFEAARVSSSTAAATTPVSIVSVQEWHYRPHLPDNLSAPVQRGKTYLPYRPPGYLLDNTTVSVQQGKYLPYRLPRVPSISRAVRLPSYIYLPPHLQRAATPSTLGSPPPELLDPRLPLTAAKIQQVMRHKDLVDADLLDAESGPLSTETQFINDITPVYPGYDLVTYPYHLDNEVGCEYEDEIDPALLPAVLRVSCPTLEKMAARPSSPPVDAPDVTATWMDAFNSLHLAWPDNHGRAMELMDLSPRDRVARVEQLAIANIPIEVSGTEVQTLPQDPVAVYFDRRISTPTPETVISRRRSAVGLVGVEKFWRDREVGDLIMPKSAPPFPKKSFLGVDEVAAVEVCFCHEMGRGCACPGRGETTGWL